ncbi:MAG: RNA-binding S4 domain-containing protein [Paracoccaceae bacterium]
MSGSAASERLDKWLWHARFFKTRTLAARQVSAGHVRVNGSRVSKPATPVRIGDGLSFPQGRAVRLVRIRAFAQRRGPATEAQGLYEDLDPPASGPVAPSPAAGARPHGRPSKKSRRAIDALRGFDP